LQEEKHPTDRMTTFAFPATTIQTEPRLASTVRDGLSAHPKRLPPWLFYDEAGSRLFDEITERPEYYLTRTERGILAAHAGQIVALVARQPGTRSAGSKPAHLRITELGAGSADKTRLLLTAAVASQGTVLYEPVDVSPSALEAAKDRIEREISGVGVSPRVTDYTHEFQLAPTTDRRLVLYIGSSIGNFDPNQAAELLSGVRSALKPGDGFLLGVDLVKDEATMLAAYDDVAGVTADFNLNLLARLNRELGAGFDLESFEHRAVWNAQESRIEMHLESRIPQRVWLNGLDLGGRDLAIDFAAGETIHTENSYKYRPEQVEAMLASAGFTPVETWTDAKGWFAVCLGRVA
jgi:dimethylhistidine N-methyltransferase